MVCRGAEVIHFPTHAESKLNRMAERQVLKERPAASRPDEGLDP